MSCTFCDLIQGAAEVSVCYEDAEAIAFMDIQPVNAGHVLVVPRQHYESLLDVPQELGAHLFSVTMRLANAVRRVTGCEGMNLVVNSGVAAGQDVFHYHVHIIPRRKGDGFDIELPFPGSEMPDRTVLDMTAARILAALQDPMRNSASGGRAGGEGRESRTAGGRDTAPRGVPAQEAAVASGLDIEHVHGIAIHREPGVRASEFAAVAPGRAEPARGPVYALAAGVLEGAHGELVRDFDGAA
jgi:histidine triad (HIT) family protein